MLFRSRAGHYESATRTINLASGPVRLSPIESRLLEYLAARPGIAVPYAELLENVWGYRKEVQTRTVYVTMDRLRMRVELDPSRPDHLRAVPGVGYRFDERVVSAAGVVPSRLRRPERVVGRASLQAALTAELTQARVVTVVGPPGVGKTTLALAVATDAAPQERVMCDLTSARDAETLEAIVGIALGVGGGATPIPTALRARGRLLVLLDNAESLPTLAEHLDAWVEAAPDTRWLVTSRAPTHARSEVLVRIPPLDVEDGADLFEALAAGRSEVTLRREEVLALLRLLDGLPLAIEIAAARTMVRTPGELREQLDGRGVEALAGPVRGETALLRSLTASWEQLSEDACRLLGALSVFEAPFTLAAACAVSPLESALTVDRLEELIERSLVQGDRRRDPWRFSILLAIRTYAREHGVAEDLAHAERQRIRWCARWGSPERIAAFATRAGELHEEGTIEVPDLWSAAAAADGEDLVDIAIGLGEMLRTRGPFSPLLAVLDRHPPGVPAPRSGRPRRRCRRDRGPVGDAVAAYADRDRRGPRRDCPS